MAQQALAKAVQAEHAAQMVGMRIDSHEKECAERYKVLDARLGNIKELYESINRLSKVVWVGVGVWTGVMGVGLVLGVIYTVIEIKGVMP